MPSARRFAGLALLVAACFGAAPPGPSPDDNVLRLTGTWSCRSLHGAQIRQVGRQDGDIVDVVRDVQWPDGTASVLDDRYRFDPRRSRWEVKAAFGSPLEFSGGAGMWQGERWDVDGTGERGGNERMTLELLPADQLRRTFSVRAASGDYAPFSAELCNRGNEVPARDACIAPAFPAVQLTDVMPLRGLVPLGASGRVVVDVGLDAASHITDARIVSSTDARLDRAALDTAKNTRFRTAQRECLPVPSHLQYVFDWR